MIRNLFIFLSWAFSTAHNVDSQRSTRLICGLVTSREEGTPLEGVAVSVKGTNNISGSQQDGMYYIEVSDRDSVLVFWLDEFRSREIRLTTANNYNIALDKGPDQATSNKAPDHTASVKGSYRTTSGKAAGHVIAQFASRPEKPPFSAIGSWRAVFQLRPGVEVPFNFDIQTAKDGGLRAFFRNGDERFDGGRVTTTTDSLFVFLDQFDNELAFQIGDHGLTGVLKKQDGSGSPLPVKAEQGVSYRFQENGTAPAGNLSGTYDIVFKSESGKEEKSVGLFRQEGNKLSGTFLHVTGDSRYLEGIVEGNNFYLSSFYGSGPAYYKGSFTKDGQLTGDSIGARGGQSFTGALNPKAALPDPYKLTWLKEGYNSFDFSLPDVDGRKVSLTDPKFKNKVVIVTIGGTWCPNCVDETAFLAPWYKENRARGIEVISIQYERRTDPEFVKKVLLRQREKYDIQYEQIFGGIADKQVVANSLPALNTFLAFPTTIIFDKKGRVAEIHTGYSGPATGEYNKAFVKEFNEEVGLLLGDK